MAQEDVRWNTDHSPAVAGVLLAGLVYALRRLDATEQSDSWRSELLEQISAHFDDTMAIPIKGDPKADRTLAKYATSDAMREAHRVLHQAFSLALDNEH